MARMFSIRKLRKHFSYFSEEECEAPTYSVPEDVKEGHFGVLAVKGSEMKRFVVKIECLNNPKFLRLLDQAEQEFGFEQTGTLVVPCTPQEFQKIMNSCGYNYFK